MDGVRARNPDDHLGTAVALFVQTLLGRQSRCVGLLKPARSVSGAGGNSIRHRFRAFHAPLHEECRLEVQGKGQHRWRTDMTNDPSPINNEASGRSELWHVVAISFPVVVTTSSRALMDIVD